MEERGAGSRRWSAFAKVLLLGVLSRAGIATADHVEPVYIDGNPRCEDVGLSGLGFKIDPPSEGTFTVEDRGEVTVAIDGVLVDWTSTFGVDAVLVKGGPNANLYWYDPAEFSDTGLHPPINPNTDRPYDISHITFCCGPAGACTCDDAGDTTAPTVDASIGAQAFVNRGYLWPPTHRLVDMELTVNVEDDCDEDPVVSMMVFGDEDDDEPTGDGVHSPDAKFEPLRLRNERRGNADGRVYLILLTATDYCGNVGYQCLSVSVPKTPNQAGIDKVIAQAAEAEAQCGAFLDYVLENASETPPGYFVIGDGEEIGPHQ